MCGTVPVQCEILFWIFFQLYTLTCEYCACTLSTTNSQVDLIYRWFVISLDACYPQKDKDFLSCWWGWFDWEFEIRIFSFLLVDFFQVSLLNLFAIVTISNWDPRTRPKEGHEMQEASMRELSSNWFAFFFWRSLIGGLAELCCILIPDHPSE